MREYVHQNEAVVEEMGLVGCCKRYGKTGMIEGRKEGVRKRHVLRGGFHASGPESPLA